MGMTGPWLVVWLYQTAFSLVGPMIQEELQDVSVGAQEDEDEEVGQGGEDDESRPKRLWRVVVEVAQELVAGWMDLMQVITITSP